MFTFANFFCVLSKKGKHKINKMRIFGPHFCKNPPLSLRNKARHATGRHYGVSGRGTGCIFIFYWRANHEQAD